MVYKCSKLLQLSTWKLKTQKKNGKLSRMMVEHRTYLNVRINMGILCRGIAKRRRKIVWNLLLCWFLFFIHKYEYIFIFNTLIIIFPSIFFCWVLLTIKTFPIYVYVRKRENHVNKYLFKVLSAKNFYFFTRCLTE